VTASPYSDWDVLREFDHWDEKTQRVVRDRLDNVPAITFFTEDEACVLQAVADRLIPQDDRPPDMRIPIVPFIDQMLAREDTDGFREPDMPWDQQAWRLGLAGIDEASRAGHGGRRFWDLDEREQDEVLTAVQNGEALGDSWERLPAKKFFTQLLQQIATVYYAHPTAWSEIGWGGPASPRGYIRTGLGRRDPWEPRERGTAPSVDIVRQREERQGSAMGSGGATH
jgi:hypothetical protein